jgi:hypothetical protein
MNAVQGLNYAMRALALEDIRRLHRLEAWPALPDRYTSLRRDLIAIRGRTPKFTKDQKESIQAAIQQLSNIEKQVEKAMGGSVPLDVHRINEVVSKQIDRLALVLVDLQNEIDQKRL